MNAFGGVSADSGIYYYVWKVNNLKRVKYSDNMRASKYMALNEVTKTEETARAPIQYKDVVLPV